jgi:MarR family transcriptional regulator, organic hydroperoxide resistance regulator
MRMRSAGMTKGAAVDRRKRLTRSIADLPLGDSVGYQVRMTNRAFQTRLRERIEPFGVSAGMWYFLRLLWQKDGQTQRELSRRIGLMDPTAFIALGGMERRGLVTRVKDRADRRKISVLLTEHGKALRDQMLPLAHEINAEGLRSLSKTEIKTLLRLLKRIEADLLANSARSRLMPEISSGRPRRPAQRG